MENGMGLLVGLGVAIAIFFICREIFCWYWKINQRLEMQEDALTEQKKQTEILEKLYLEQCTCKAYLEAMQEKDRVSE